MMEIERVQGLDRETFWRRYVLEHRPVVITDLLRDAPIAGVRTREEAIAELGRTPLVIRPEYGRSLLSTLAVGPDTSHAPETVSLRGYFRIVDHEPTTARMCIEEPTPPEVSRLAPVPALATAADGSPDAELKSTIFVGNQGNSAPLHYDGDSRHVLLYQVFGLKRVVVIGAQHGAALRPIANFSTLHWATCPPHERYDLLDRLGGVETVIGPGEAIFMPALGYHAADYVEDGMSVNFRFGRNRYHELFSAHVHLDPNAQRLMAASLTERAAETTFRDAYRRVVDELCKAAPTSWTKRQRMVALLAELTEGLRDDAVARVESSAFVALPEVVVQALHRAHLFKDQLYRQRETVSPASLGVPLVA